MYARALSVNGFDRVRIVLGDAGAAALAVRDWAGGDGHRVTPPFLFHFFLFVSTIFAIYDIDSVSTIIRYIRFEFTSYQFDINSLATNSTNALSVNGFDRVRIVLGDGGVAALAVRDCAVPETGPAGTVTACAPPPRPPPRLDSCTAFFLSTVC